MLELWLLGPLEVVRDGEPVPLPRHMHRALLALLAVHANEVVSTDRLIEELWAGQPPATAKDALQNYVSQLRKAIGREVIVTRPPGYVLELENGQTDVGRFERQVVAASTADSAESRATILREALALWRGPALADLAYESFVASESARLEQLRAVAQEDLADAELELGHHADLVPRLEELVESHPFDERVRAQLMLALYRSGRQADALEVFQETRQALADELGLDPSPALRELERAILLQEPSLVSSDGAAPTAAERRKMVTVLSAELAPVGELDAERQRAEFVRGIAAARTAVERHEGWVSARAGEELLGVFGVPTAHEDDALRAVRAADEMRDAIAPNDALQLRVGIDSGEALTGHGFVSGNVTRIASRLQRAAKPGEILVGGTALGLVRHAVEGRRTRAGFRLDAVQIDAPAVAQRIEAPLVGRERELGELIRQFDEACCERRCRLVVLAGEPGIGKSRLARELANRVDEAATVRIGRCVAYGEGAAYLPLRQILSTLDLDTALAGTEDGEQLRQRATELIGLAEGTTSVAEGFWAVRRIFSALAGERPLVLVLEDLHWAEPRLLELVQELETRAHEPMLLICTGRPELLDTQPAWREQALELEPLATEEIRALVDAVEADLEPALATRLVEVAEGNPLYAEQLLAYAEERGEAGLESVPPSVGALLAARIDLLEASVRSTAARSALIGRDFSRTALSAITAPEGLAEISAHIVQLVRRGFVRPAATAAGEELYRFHHALLRDVAYASLPKAERADLHETYGDWLATSADAPDEVVGHHLEQAYRYRTELAPPDRRTRQLATDAGTKLGVAGMRRWRMNDRHATVDLLGRAVDLLPPEDAGRRELSLELGLAEHAAGKPDLAERALREASTSARNAGDRRIELRATLELSYQRLLAEPEGGAAQLLDVAEQAIPVFDALGDDRSLGRAWIMAGFVHGGIHAQHAAWQEAAERALFHYRRAGSATTTCLSQIGWALYWGPLPVPEAIAQCHQLIDSEPGITSQAGLLPFLGGLEAQRGDFKRARELVTSAEALHAELGQVGSVSVCGTITAHIELLAGNDAEAEQVLRMLTEYYETTQDRSTLAPRCAELAEALYRQDRVDEALDVANRARDLSASDDAHAYLLWRPVLAKALARRGEVAEATSLANEAVRLSDETDWLNARAATRLALSEILVEAERVDDAMTACTEAVRLFDLRGNTPGAERARAMLESVAV